MTLFPTLRSSYAILAFTGLFALSLLGAFVASGTALCIQAATKPEWNNRVFASSLHATSCLMLLFAWSIMQGMQVLPFYATFLLATPFIFPYAAIITLIASPRSACGVFRRGYASWADAGGKKDDGRNDDVLGPNAMMEASHSSPSTEVHEVGKSVIPQHTVLVRTPERSAGSSNSNHGAAGASDTGDDDDDDVGPLPAIAEPEGGCYFGPVHGVRPPLGALFAELRSNRLCFGALFLAFCVCNGIVHIMTYGGCACLHPVDFTTWASRGLAKSVCPSRGICHAYFMVGSDASNLGAVVHFKGERPRSRSALVCFGDATSRSNCTSPPAGGISVRSGVVEHLPVPGDVRFLVQYDFRDLPCDQLLTVFFAVNDSQGKEHVVSRRVRTLPCSAAAKVGFVAGGDFHSGGRGVHLLRSAVKRLGDTASFVYIGGDLSYTNNMRFCYERYDYFLREVATLTRDDGAVLPIIVAVGNHEGGSYMLFDSYAARERAFYFHRHYFPSFAFAPGSLDHPGPADSSVLEYESGDWTATYHRHIIGHTGWIVLDSGIVFSTSHQRAYLRDALGDFCQRIRDGSISKIIVTYHNPAFPSVRDFMDPHSLPVREQFVPLLEEYFPHVSWVMEHHDHAYKRTHPLLNGSRRERGNVSLPAGGIVYSGDGSLGVADFTRGVEKRWYHDRVSEGNYAITAVLLGNQDAYNRTAHVVVLGEGGPADVKDDFYV